ncbi:MAG TPA: PAS domain S-box protein, partial [Rariglobus sp.]
MNNPSPEPSGRVLLVDDNRSIHSDFLKILCRPDSPADTESMESSLFGAPVEERRSVAFEVDSAYQGQEALDLVIKALAENRPYAMAFMDVRMPPGWDGVETTAKIWEIDPDIQIVICTAYSDYSWDEMIQKLGHSDKLLILKKPFDNVEALQLASALTEKWRLLQHVHRQVGQLEERVRQRTAELSRSEQRYRLITENTGDLIEIIDASGQPLYRSPSCERLFDPPTGGLEVVHPDDRETVAAAMRECLHDARQQTFDFRARGRNETWLTMEAHCGPFRDDHGQVEAVLMVSRDVTERRKLELHLRQAQKLESIGQLATGIAHEINTPIQFICNNTHFLRSAFADMQALLARYGELLATAESGAIPPERLSAVRSALATANPDYLSTEIPKAIEDMLSGVARTAKIVKAMRNFAHPGTASKTPVKLVDIAEDALTITRNEWRYVADAVTEFDPAL